MKKPFLLTVLGIVLVGLFLNLKPVHAVYNQIDWDNSFSPSGLPPGTQLSVFGTPYYGGLLFVGATNGRLYLSSDGGDNWTETQPAGNVNKNWVALSMTEDGEVLVAAAAPGRLYLSLDGGDSWSETEPAGPVGDQNWANVAITDSGDVLLTTINGGRMYRTEDLGNSWDPVGAPLNVNLEWSTLFYTNSRHNALAAAKNGRMYISSNNGLDWSEVQPGGDADYDWSAVSCGLGTLTCAAAAKGGRVYVSSSEGFEWDQVYPAGDVDKNWSTVAISDSRNIIAAEDSGRLYYTLDPDLPWYESQPNGNVDHTYSSVLLANNGTEIWVANKSAVIYKGEFSIAQPGQPSNLIASDNSTSIKRLVGEPLFKVNALQNSGTSIFSLAHGNVQIGNKFYIGTRTNPSKIVVFNNPNNLSDYTSVTLPGLVGLESLTYDSVHHRIYGVGNSSLTPQNLKIYSFDPDNIASYSQVVNNATLIDNGSSSIITDGTYVYGVTYATPPKLFKIRISDWSLQASRDWTGGPSSGHSSALQVYSDRTELYFGASLGTTAIAKVNASDLSYVEYNFGTTLSFSDDIYFRYLDDTGGILYIGKEGTNTGYALDTRTMTPTAFMAPRTFGYFSDGRDLYATGNLGYLARYIDFDLDSGRFYELPGEIPNEMFFSSTGKKFFTNWSTPGYIKQYEETNILATSSSVTLTWDVDDPVPETIYEIYISTDGIAYSLQGRIGSTSYTVAPLVPNTQYWFRIIATNGPNTSTPVTSNLTTPLYSPAGPASISKLSLISRTKTSLSLSWESTNADEYIIKQGSASSGWISSTSYTFSDLTCGQEYQVKVKGRNSDDVQGDYLLRSFSTEPCSSGTGIVSNNTSTNNSNNNQATENKTVETDKPANQPSTSSVTHYCDNLTFIPVSLYSQKNLSLLDRLKGRILLAVEDKGKLYYIEPRTNQPYYLTEDQAQCVLEKASLGITDQNLLRIPEINSSATSSSLSNRLKGYMLLQVENKGQVWFVDQEGWRHKIVKNNLISTVTKFALGIMNADLKKIISFDK